MNAAPSAPAPTSPFAGPRAPLMRRLALAGAAAAVVLTSLSGCDGSEPESSGVASLAPSGGGDSSASADTGTEPSALAYSQCMREHGVKDFPDPNADGEIQLNTGPGSDLDPDNPTFKAADDACKSLLPHGGGGPSTEIKAANLKYAECMRDHGVKDFPDPNADGALQLQSTPGSDLDPNNPTYKSADDACKQHLPDGGAGQSLNSHDG